MIIRKATELDLTEFERIIDHARKQMRLNGNPYQWNTYYPTRELFERELSANTIYAVVDNGKIIGTFSFTIGEDKTYAYIENGKWLNSLPYGTVHHLASDNTKKGVFNAVLEFVKSFNVDIRIDTHECNSIMLHLLEKHGFTYCGIIYVADGTPRQAFQLENTK